MNDDECVVLSLAGDMSVPKFRAILTGSQQTQVRSAASEGYDSFTIRLTITRSSTSNW